LVPFSVRQSQEKRTNPGVSFVEYIEISVFGNIYKLMKNTATRKLVFTINSLEVYAPYNSLAEGIQIYGAAGGLNFVSNFGLNVIWDGSSKSNFSLCNAYKNYTCGMCGNGDGNKTLANEIVDRNRNPLNTTGGATQHYSRFGDSWKSDKLFQQKSRLDISGKLLV